MLKKIINLGIIVPIGYLAITTIALNISGLDPLPTLALLMIALFIGLFAFKEVGPVVFGPGVGGATIAAPILMEYGHTAVSVAVASVGLVQILISLHKRFLRDIHPPKELKIFVLFVLAFYLLHKPQVQSLFDRFLHPDVLDQICLVKLSMILIFMGALIALALKPFFPNKFPKFISFGNILGLAFLYSILSISLPTFGELSLANAIPTDTSHEMPAFWQDFGFWSLVLILIIVDVLEGYFNYKTAVLITNYEEPPTATRLAFFLSGCLNLVSSLIGASTVMTGLLKVSLFQESGGENKKTDLQIVFVGTLILAFLYTLLIGIFAQWLFATLLLFVGLKLLVKGITELLDHLSHTSEKTINPWRAYWIVGVFCIFTIVFTVHKNPLMWGIVFSIGFTILRNIIAKLASKSDPTQELHTH